jgi:hypothetical protein
LGTTVQKPVVAARLHALQASVQAELQQTPCAQNPDSQSLPELHTAPSSPLPHELLTHVFGGTQSVSLVQLLKQAFPLQMYGLQLRDGGATHCPAWLQVSASVNEPRLQLEDPHLVPTG